MHNYIYIYTYSQGLMWINPLRKSHHDRVTAGSQQGHSNASKHQGMAPWRASPNGSQWYGLKSKESLRLWPLTVCKHNWLVVRSPLWKIWVRQLGWLFHSQLRWESIKFMATSYHQPDRYNCILYIWGCFHHQVSHKGGFISSKIPSRNKSCSDCYIHILSTSYPHYIHIISTLYPHYIHIISPFKQPSNPSCCSLPPTMKRCRPGSAPGLSSQRSGDKGGKTW